MPSPVGHALGGLAAGWLVAGRNTSSPRLSVGDAVVFAAAGMAADLDLLFAVHRGPTHAIGAVVAVGIVIFVATRRRRFAAAVAAAYASHTLLDWLGTDTTSPMGIMALWPFSREYFYSGWRLFPAISRRYWLAEFWVMSVRAVAWEVLLLGPIVALAAYVRSRGNS